MKGTRKVGAGRTKLCLKLGNIPLEGRLIRLSQENESGLSQFSPEGNPIRCKKVDGVTGADVTADEILKGKKIGNTTVTFTEDELDAACSRRQLEIGKVRVEDIQDIPATDVKSIYAFKPDNNTFWGLIGGRMLELRKELHFLYVEGRQERAAILQIRENLPTLFILYFPSEIADMGQQEAPLCSPAHAPQVDALLTALQTTAIPEVDEKRNFIIGKLVEAKLTGQPIPAKPVVEAKVQKGKSVEELLKESLAIAQIAQAK